MCGSTGSAFHHFWKTGAWLMRFARGLGSSVNSPEFVCVCRGGVGWGAPGTTARDALNPLCRCLWSSIIELSAWFGHWNNPVSHRRQFSSKYEMQFSWYEHGAIWVKQLKILSSFPNQFVLSVFVFCFSLSSSCSLCLLLCAHKALYSFF